MNIPSNINEHIPQNENVNILSNINEHVSTCNSDINIPTKIKDVDIPQNVNDNQHKNVNIPPVNVDIPSSQTNLPNYNPSSIYHYKYNPIRRKLSLKIDPGNDKGSFSIVYIEPYGNLFLI